tara:strand:- start:2049 stop:2606 length:558 start_codon:yes stop_codon:yes gene_type:complete
MIQNLFSTPIYKTKLNLDTVAIRDYCLTVPTNNFEHDQGGSNTPDLEFDKHPILHPLFMSVIDHANRFYQDLQLGTSNVYMTASWISICKHKDFNMLHKHHTALISGVYHVYTPTGDIVFQNPNPHVETLWNTSNKQYNEYNSPTWSFPPEPNNLYLFPSWLDHYVKPNLSRETRVAISFNLNEA